MNFDDAYQLLELVEADSERETYTAREKATGREVLIHLLATSSEQVPSLRTIAERYLAAQGATDSELGLKIGTFQTEPCLITESAAALRNIRRALEQRSASDPFEKANKWRVPAVNEAVPENPVSTAPAPASFQGEFTRMFEVSPPVSAVPPPPPAVGISAAPVQPAPAPPAPLEAGGFTQMFSAPVSRPERGEITLMFENESPAPAPEVVPPVTARPDAGDFTRMFKPDVTPAPVAKEPRPERAEAPEPEAAPPVTARPDAGDFTRMFKPDATPAPVAKQNWPEFVEKPKPEAAPPAVSKPDSGDFTRMFKPDAKPAPVAKENWLDFAERPQQSISLDSINWDSPPAQGATGAFAVRSSSPPEPAVSHGPSDFTRLISVPSNLPPQPGSPPAAPAAPEPPAPAASNLPIIIALNVLVIAVVALILYFVLRR